VLLAGPGDADEIRKSVSPDIAERLTFLGLVSEEDKIRAFHSADIYVAPNTGGESFGIVLLEAMAAGTAVVASDLEAFRRVLDNSSAGVHFRNGDADDLARAINEVLADDAARAEMVRAAHARAWMFDWGQITREIVDVYRSVRAPNTTDPGVGQQARESNGPVRDAP
jgi:phosphatidylinositol alpha-mannosyltransferase